jgi:segregation and condensation protein B
LTDDRPLELTTENPPTELSNALGEPALPPAPALPALLEALLFVAPSPTPITRLAQVLGIDAAKVEEVLVALEDSYVSQDRGVRLLRKGDRVHLTSAPSAASFIEKFLGLDLSTKLSTAALETLAVVAYRQPLTRAEIEAIRGVNCDGVMKTLLSRELVEAVGRLEQPGRPFVYGTTVQFLQYFGIESLERLPPLPPDSPVALPTESMPSRNGET